MILTAGLIIGIMSVFIEWKLVNSWVWMQNVYANGIKTPFGTIPGIWVNNGFSACLGLILGGGTTIVAMIGAATGLFLSNALFGAHHQLTRAGIDKAWAKDKTKGLSIWFTENKHHFANLGKTIMVTIKVITAPMRFGIAVNTKFHESKEGVAGSFNKVRSKIRPNSIT